MKTIPYNRQYIDSKDIKYVSKALKEDIITTGKYVKKFEDKFIKFFQSKYVLTCSSGTSALHLAFASINLKKDDVVIMPAINFIAAYSMAKLMNARIFLADTDYLTGQMTPTTLLECIKKNKIKKIKAVVNMYLGGYPENIINFYRIKKKYNFVLIEDACHALGAKYKFKEKYINIGSCKHSDIAVFSLHPVKTITSGEGGVITTNNKILYNRQKMLRSHYIIRENKKKHWKYQINKIGFNYRLSDINCALGLSQFKKINKFISFRKKIFNIYRNKLKTINNLISFPPYNNNYKSAYHLFIISINFEEIKATKDKLLKLFKKAGILCQYHYIPIYKFNLFQKKIDLNHYKGAEYYYKNSLSLPIFYNLGFVYQKKILKLIKVFLNRYSN
jgi:dTDP-4-amino-4,6-dideoxygalactose transaminase